MAAAKVKSLTSPFQRPFQPGLLTKFADAPRMARLERAGPGFKGAVRNPALEWTLATDMERRWIPAPQAMAHGADLCRLGRAQRYSA